MHALLALVTAKKGVPALFAVGTFFVAVFDPTLTGLAVVGAIGAVGTCATVIYSARAAARERELKALADTEERKALAAERIADAAARRILLEKADRAEREITANTKLTERVAESTAVIEGHVNSEKTRAVEERRAQAAKADAAEKAHEAEVAMLREVVLELRTTARELAASRAVQDAITASSTVAAPAAPPPVPAAVTVQGDSSDLKKIETHTKETAHNTAKTSATVQELKKDDAS